MHHVAIMKKSWHLTDKILTGMKTIESRWYKTKRIPWGKINIGDTIWFKDTGCPITLKATVSEVDQFEIKDDYQREEIYKKYGAAIFGQTEPVMVASKYSFDKRYCILVHLKNPQKVEKPFDIDKTGFGVMSAWIVIDDIKKIKK